MTGEPTVRRGGSGALGLVMAVAVLGLVELAIVGVLIVLPLLDGAELETWRIGACMVLLMLASGVFVAVSLVRVDGKLRWRWTR